MSEIPQITAGAATRHQSPHPANDNPPPAVADWRLYCARVFAALTAARARQRPAFPFGRPNPEKDRT